MIPRRHLLLAGLLAGCSHPLPPRPQPSPQALWRARVYPHGLPASVAPDPLPAPAPAGPPVTRTPPVRPRPPKPADPPAGPGTGMDLRADPANPYPQPDPALPPDARML